MAYTRDGMKYRHLENSGWVKPGKHYATQDKPAAGTQLLCFLLHTNLNFFSKHERKGTIWDEERD